MSVVGWIAVAAGAVLVLVALAGVWYDRTVRRRRLVLLTADEKRAETMSRYYTHVQDSVTG